MGTTLWHIVLAPIYRMSDMKSILQCYDYVVKLHQTDAYLQV